MTAPAMAVLSFAAAFLVVRVIGELLAPAFPIPYSPGVHLGIVFITGQLRQDLVDLCADDLRRLGGCCCAGDVDGQTARQGHEHRPDIVDEVGHHSLDVLAAVHGALELTELEGGDVCLAALEVSLSLQTSALDLAVLLRRLPAVGLGRQVSDVPLDRRQQVVAVGVAFLDRGDDALLGELLHSAGRHVEQGRDGLAVDELVVGWVRHGVPSFLPLGRNETARKKFSPAARFLGSPAPQGRGARHSTLRRCAWPWRRLRGAVVRSVRVWRCGSGSVSGAAVDALCGVLVGSGLEAEGSLHVVLEALAGLGVEPEHDGLVGAVAGYHLRHRDGGQFLDVGAGLAHSLEWDPARAVALGVACPHENIVRSLRERAARGTGVQIAADYLLLSLEHRRLQRVALTAGRGLRRHAEVHRGQEPALVGDGELLDGLAGDLDAAGHLLRLSAARGRDLRLLDVVDGRDLLSDPARGSGLDVLDGVADGLLAAVLDCLEVSDELLQVAELRRDAVLRHSRRLLPIRKKRPAGVGSPVGLLPSVVIRFSSGQPLGIVTALPVCPAVFCRI